MTRRSVICVVCLALAFCGRAGNTLPRPVDRSWKLVYASSEGMQGRALELLTAEVGTLLLRDNLFHSFRVLPMEKEGGAVLDYTNAFIVGRWEESPAVRRWLKAGDVPKGGYCVKAWHEAGTNRVVIAGDRPVDVLYGVVDFVEDALPALRVDSGNGVMYRTRIFDGSPIGIFNGHGKPRVPYVSRRAPETAVRSLFTWGHVVDDYPQFFREVARLKLNRVILWNDYPPVNAADVVACAHSWGISVHWGFAWGWGTGCDKLGGGDFDALVAGIVANWRQNWRDLPGDGIYFQTFTEREPGKLGDETVTQRAVRLVNTVTQCIRAEKPDLPIVFGLHATSVRNEMEVVAKVDPSLEILWEDCGGFPYSANITDDRAKDLAFTRQIAAHGPSYGLAFKWQLLQDWCHWEHQAGPFLLGCAGRGVLARDRRVSDELTEAYPGRWIAHGDFAHAVFEAARKSGHPPAELNTVVEYNPPFDFTTALVAEMFWSTSEPFAVIRDRVLARTREKN